MMFEDHIVKLSGWLAKNQAPHGKVLTIVSCYYTSLVKEYLNEDPLADKYLVETFRNIRDMDPLFCKTDEGLRKLFNDLLKEIYHILNCIPDEIMNRYQTLSLSEFTREYDWANISYRYYNIVFYICKEVFFKLKIIDNHPKIIRS